MQKQTLQNLVPIAGILSSVFLALYLFKGPQPLGREAPSEEFSANRALENRDAVINNNLEFHAY